MKLIQVIIEPDRLDSVTQALAKAEVFRLTVYEVQGAGHQTGSEDVAGKAVELDFLPKLCLEIAVNEAFVEPTIEAILAGVGDRSVGVGKILVLPLADAIRIRTGEHGPQAI